MAAALLAAIASGCSTVRSGYAALDSEYDAWTGHPAQDLLDSWGPPDATEALGNDYLAYTWLGDDEACRRTFTASAGTITGYSETDCP